MADTLAQAIKKKYPGVYDSWPDQQLEEAVIARYPGSYDNWPRTPAGAPAAAKPAAVVPAAERLRTERGLSRARRAAPAESPTPETGAFLPAPGEFVRRMGRQLVRPIEPIARGGHALADIIEGVPRPQAETSMMDMVRQVAGRFQEAPGVATAEAALELTGLPAIVDFGREAIETARTAFEPEAYSPAARVKAGLPPHPTMSERLAEFVDKRGEMARAGIAGTIEGISRLSPLEAVMLRMGGRRKPAGPTVDTTLLGRTGRPTPREAATAAAIEATAERAATREAADVARQATDALKLSLAEPSDLTPRLRTAAGAARAETPAAQAFTERALREGADPAAARREARARQAALTGRPARPERAQDFTRTVLEGAVRDLEASRPESVSLPPSELPPEPSLLGIRVDEKGRVHRLLEEPGGALGAAKYSGYKGPSDPQLAADIAAKKKAAADKTIDALAEREAREVRKRALEAGETPSELPVPGTPAHRAYRAGATPAEAAAAASAARAAGTAAARAAVLPTGAELAPAVAAAERRVETAAKAAAPAAAPARTALEIAVDARRQVLAEQVRAARAAGTEDVAAFQALQRIGDLPDGVERRGGLRPPVPPGEPIPQRRATDAGPAAAAAIEAAAPAIAEQAAAAVAPPPTVQQVMERAAARTAAPAPATAAPVAAPAAPTKAQTLKESLAAEKFDKKLAQWRPKDSKLARDVARYRHLKKQEGAAQLPGQAAEMEQLRRRIAAHEEAPPVIRKGLSGEAPAAPKPEAAAPKPPEPRPAPRPVVPPAAADPRATVPPETIAPDQPASVRSEAAAAVLAESIPAASSRSRATLPPEAAYRALAESLGVHYAPESLVPLIERARQALPAAEAAAAEAGLGPTAARPTPAAQMFIDALEEFTAQPVEAPAPVGYGTRPPPAVRISVPRAVQGQVGFGPQGATGLQMRRGRLAREGRERLVAATPEMRKPAARPAAEVPRVTSPAEALAAPTRARDADRLAALMRKNATDVLTPAESAEFAALRARERAPGAPARPQSPLERARAAAEAKATQQQLGPPPPGVEPELWAHVHAVEAEARALQLEQGITDPRLIDELAQFWGVEEAAHRAGLIPEGASRSTRNAAINLVKEISGGGKPQPMTKVLADTEARLRFLMDNPNGFFRIESLLVPTGVAAGAAVGAALEGDNAIDRLAYALSGALIGGALGKGAARGARAVAARAGRPGARSIPGRKERILSTIETVDSANMLFGPAIIKASLGSLGAVAAALTEAHALGNKRAFRAGLRTVISTRKDGMVRTYLRTLGQPVPVTRGGAYTGAVAQRLGMTTADNKITRLARQALKPFNAADTAATKVLRDMGVSQPEAERLMLMGEPTSWLGQTVLNAINSSFNLRMLMKFSRVPIVGLERGIEYTPFLNRRFNTRPTALEARQKHGARAAGFRQAERLSPAQLRARARFGGAAILAGAAYGYLRDPGYGEAGVVAAAAGPAFIPASVAMAAGKAVRAGKNPGTEALLELAKSVPRIEPADIINLSSRLVPLSPARRALNILFGEGSGRYSAEDIE